MYETFWGIGRETLSNYKNKLKQHIAKTPKEGFTSKSIRKYYSDLRDLSRENPTFKKAREMTERYFNNNNNNNNNNNSSSSSSYNNNSLWILISG